jgi:hypothetical protein
LITKLNYNPIVSISSVYTGFSVRHCTCVPLAGLAHAYAYEAATNAVLEAVESLQDQEGEPAAKRQRLESVVVTVKESPRAANTKMPPPAKPTWSTGEIERPAGGGGRGGPTRGVKGPRGRGYFFKPYRGAYSGRRGGHRGGRY